MADDMKTAIFLCLLILLIAGYGVNQAAERSQTEFVNLGDQGGLEEKTHPLSIEELRKVNYPGSNIIIEKTLPAGPNYQRYIASYQSEGLKINALLTIPDGEMPKSGWPVIIFNHGYIPPQQYQTTERYVAYTDAFSANNYIVFKPDYRGHGNSEGQATGGYGSNAYTIDVLNAVAAIKKYKVVNPLRIGMWGHSLGGYITLRAMVVSKDIKVGVIWAGVVASYPDLLSNWRRRNFTPPPGIRSSWRQELVQKYGDPQQNPRFWDSISANSYLKDISGPLQLHHGTADSMVPLIFSQKLARQMKEAAQEVKLHIYEADDHNLVNNLTVALNRSVEFFDKYLKD